MENAYTILSIAALICLPIGLFSPTLFLPSDHPIAIRFRQKRTIVLASLFLFLFFGVLGSNGTSLSSYTEHIPDSPEGSPRAENIATENTHSPLSPKTNTLARVTRVIDGDTIELDTGERVRYIGINTPETVDPRRPIQCFGKEASRMNKELVEGKIVRLEKDTSDTDKYGRLLRYVYAGSTFVNKKMVEEGYAYASSYPPDVGHQEEFSIAMREAKEEGRGLWASCGINKDTQQNTSATLPHENAGSEKIPTKETRAIAPGCVIKGNISTSGNIYHLPGCGSYEKTVINTDQGERMFCTEEEALNAGWRKAKNCP